MTVLEKVGDQSQGRSVTVLEKVGHLAEEGVRPGVGNMG